MENFRYLSHMLVKSAEIYPHPLPCPMRTIGISSEG
jgi:hypothetical protein